MVKVMKSVPLALLVTIVATMNISCSNDDEPKDDNADCDKEVVQPQDDNYYWYNKFDFLTGKREKVKILFEYIPTKKYVVLRSPEDSTAFKEKYTKEGTTIRLYVSPPPIFSVGNLSYSCFACVEGDDLPNFWNDELVSYVNNYFYFPEEGPEYDAVATGQINVKLRDEADIVLLEEMADKYKVNILGYSTLLKNVYYLECTKQSCGGNIYIANCLYQSDLFEYATPDMRAVIILHSSEKEISF